MNRVLTSAAAALFLCAGLVGCGDDKGSPGGPATTPVASSAPGSGVDAGSLSGKDLECKDEIVRQMTDPTQQTADTPPECKGVSDDRISELAAIADDEAAKASAKPSGDTS